MPCNVDVPPESSRPTTNAADSSVVSVAYSHVSIQESNVEQELSVSDDISLNRSSSSEENGSLASTAVEQDDVSFK